MLLSSDRLRKELAGRCPYASAKAAYGQGIYAPAYTERTYAALLDRAEALLARGETVLLDASWSAARHRDAARAVAAHTHSQLVELHCLAPPDVVTERLRRRNSMSDADTLIAETVAEHTDPWPEATPIHTDQPLPATVNGLTAHMTAVPATEKGGDARRAA